MDAYEVKGGVGLAADEAEGLGELHVLLQGVEIDRIYTVETETGRNLGKMGIRMADEERGKEEKGKWGWR